MRITKKLVQAIKQMVIDWITYDQEIQNIKKRLKLIDIKLSALPDNIHPRDVKLMRLENRIDALHKRVAEFDAQSPQSVCFASDKQKGE